MNKISLFLSLFLFLTIFCRSEIQETCLSSSSFDYSICNTNNLTADEISDIKNNSVRYIYSDEDPTLLIGQIQASGLMTTYQYDELKRCIALFRQEGDSLILRSFYSYSDEGVLEKIVIDDGSKWKADDLTDVTWRNFFCVQDLNPVPLLGDPLEIEKILFDIQSNESKVFDNLLSDCVDEEQLIADQQEELILLEELTSLINLKDEEGNEEILVNGVLESEINEQKNEKEFFSAYEISDRLIQTFYDCFQHLQLSAHQAKMRWNTELKLPPLIAHELQRIGKALLGSKPYLLMGFHFEETHVDTYGESEISDKVRITFINGILNSRAILQESLETFSRAHGGVKIHHVFRPTEGWVWDILRAISIKVGYYMMGIRSFHARLLAQLWRELIDEMGGVGAGGVIIHYAHSLGGSETDRARNLLTPEEQKMIRVITLGTATMIRNEGFQNVVNLISVSDPIRFFDPIGLMRNSFDPNTNLRFYSSLFTTGLTDHMLDGVTYNKLINELGESFLKEFSPQKQ